MTGADTLDDRFAAAMGALTGPEFPSDIALAVSGGGDSMAMLALAHGWARVWGVRLHVVTVDHGLRPESAEEAALVARECAALGTPHTVLRWQWDGQGNVMDAARRARLDLIGAWRSRIGPAIDHVLLAHTSDDVAETFLLRLARGSGVEGLSAMQARRRVAQGFEVVRPCLDMTREELRHYARTLQLPWVDDPTNDNPKYDRARARAMLGTLEGLGLTRGDLVATAQRMARAREALTARAVAVAREVVRAHPSGTLIFDRDGFARIERDTQMRLLSAAIRWVSGATYRPRQATLEEALDRVLAGGAATLSGAKLEAGRAALFVLRELAAVTSGQTGGLWDGRWRISGAEWPVQALGEAVSSFPDWRDAGVPRAALMAMPAVFEGNICRATPVLSVNPACHMEIDTSFSDFLLSH